MEIVYYFSIKNKKEFKEREKLLIEGFVIEVRKIELQTLINTPYKIIGTTKENYLIERRFYENDY